MYHCKDCNRKFDTPQKFVETHGQTAPPFEVFFLCPFCGSTNFKKIIIGYCKCCGRRLNNPDDYYCSESCRINAIKLKRKDELRKQALVENPLNILIKEVEEYNNQHKTKYSYGQYIAIVKAKLRGKENDR